MTAVSLNDLTIGYDDGGDGGGDGGRGPALVLIHGHPFDRSMWHPQIEEFGPAGWRVIAPDLRGYGETTVVPGTTELSTFARDVAALLDHLGIERFVLGGLSMGGQVVMELYRLFPQRIRALLLADTSAAAETEEGKAIRDETADLLLAEGMTSYANEVLPKMVAPDNIRTMPAVAKHVLHMMRGTDPEGAAAALRGRALRPDYLDLLSRVTAPTLVLVGSDDEYTPVEDAELIHDRIPGSTLAVIDGAAHMPNLERSTEFNAVVRRFLETLPPAE